MAARRPSTDALALAAGVLGTTVWHWPVFASRFGRLPGDQGDARVYAYLVEHWYQVFRGHGEALSPGMFYPAKGTLGYAETMFLHALPYSGLRLAGMEMFSALVAPLILFTLLNYVTGFFLLRRVIGLNAVASVAGAMFFSFNGPRFSNPGHYSFQASFFLPIVIACIVRLVQRQDSLTQREAFALSATAALSLALQFVVSPYQGWLFVFWSCLFFAIVLAIRATRLVAWETVRRSWRALTGAVVVFAIALYPTFLVYMPVAASVGPRRYSAALQLMPDAWSLLQLSPLNYVWGGVSAEMLRVHPQFSSELYVGIGLVPTVILLGLMFWAVGTIVKEVRRPKTKEGSPGIQRLVLSALILSIALFYAIAMKYWGDRSPWRFVYEFVPGADGLRAIARHVLVLALPMSIGFAVIVHRSMQWISAQSTTAARRGWTMALLSVISFSIAEQFGRTPSISSKAELSRLEPLASSVPQTCGVFYVAAAPGRAPGKHEDQIDAMLISVMRGIPTVNGYSGHVPPGWSLREVDAPDYEQRVARWIDRYHVTGPVCRLEIGD